MKPEQDARWARWVEVLPRFAAANQRAEDDFLAGLSREEGLRIFEDLCSLDFGHADDWEDGGHPVALIRLWRAAS